VNEVEALGDRRFAALLVTPHGLGHEERHGAALALLLVQIDDAPLPDQHVTDDDRYAWLNDRVCAVEGEVRPRADGAGFDVVLEVSEMVWEGVSA